VQYFPETSLGQMLSVILCCETDVNIIAVIYMIITVKMKEADLSKGGHNCGVLE